MNMNIDAPHSGTLEVAPDRIIEFPNGMAGFEQFRRYSLFHPQTDDGTPPRYFILQSLDDESVAFNIADPELFGFNYEISLSDEESAALELSDPSEAAVVVVLVKEAGELRANLKAPLVVNLRTRRGIQHVFARLNYQVTLKSPE
jgi:flagellar assembly factor FliW